MQSRSGVNELRVVETIGNIGREAARREERESGDGVSLDIHSTIGEWMRRDFNFDLRRARVGPATE